MHTAQATRFKSYAAARRERWALRHPFFGLARSLDKIEPCPLTELSQLVDIRQLGRWEIYFRAGKVGRPIRICSNEVVQHHSVECWPIPMWLQYTASKWSRTSWTMGSVGLGLFEESADRARTCEKSGGLHGPAGDSFSKSFRSHISHAEMTRMKFVPWHRCRLFL